MPGFPILYLRLMERLFFDENQIRIDNITGTSGGGDRRLTGSLLFGEEKIRRYLLNLRIQGHEVRIRYPEGMRNVVDADLALRFSTIPGALR